MAHGESRKAKSKAAAVAAAAAVLDAAAEMGGVQAPDHEVIARLAYEHWQARGCPEGSPEVDWFQAEADLRGQTAVAAAGSAAA